MKRLTPIIVMATAFGFGSTAHAENLMDVYRHLHSNPELSNMEVQTAAYLAKRLEKLGYTVTEQVGGTGVVALLKNGPGKTVMIRADMDALPVEENTGLPFASKVRGLDAEGKEWPVMHACGHDIHMTTLIGTAEMLAENKNQWSGTLMLILQPAEELGQGARQMLDDGLFTRFGTPDYNLALHVNSNLPAGRVGVVPGYALANVDSVDILIKGIGGHGAYPNTTKDPIVLASQLVLALQTIVSREISPLEPAVVTVGSIHGGTKHNIIGEEVRLQLTLRSYTDEVRDQTIKTIERIADGLGRAAGLPDDKLPIVSRRDEFTPAAYNNPELAERQMAVFRNVIGDDRVLKLDPVMGGEDFGQFGRTSAKIPSLIYWLGAANPAEVKAAQKEGRQMPSLHSPFFKPDAAPAIETGVETMTAAALDLLSR